MVRPEIVRRKLRHLHLYLQELERHRGVTISGYRSSPGPRREIERLIQLLVEVAVDINTHLVTESAGVPPKDYRESFKSVAQAGVITHELAEKLMPSAGLRNALVHDYADVDDKRVHAAIPLALDGFGAYANEVLSWLEPRP
ncbi:MAG: type VII toxin-antitoxin system HepT family RNase toxin [Actinomycetota bacterium]